MRCPYCSGSETMVKDSRPSEDTCAVRRRRECQTCGGRFTTYERVQLRDLIVIKSGGYREVFDRSKLERSVHIAFTKRGLDENRVNQMVSGIVRRLEERGDRTIDSQVIGDVVMESLARIDLVAYVRFASVYKDFQNPHDFELFVAELRPALKPD